MNDDDVRPGGARLRDEARLVTTGTGWADAAAATVLLFGWFLVETDLVDVSSEALQYGLLFVGLALAARATVMWILALH